MHPYDEEWVKRKINELPTIELKQLAWVCYKRKFTTVFNDEVNEVRKENRARFAANSALRLYVDKILNKSLANKTIK